MPSRIFPLALLCFVTASPAMGDTTAVIPAERPAPPQFPAAPKPRPDPHFRFNSADFYPPNAIRCGESGAVQVGLVIAEDGTVDSAFLGRSSGFDDLDAAGMNAARSMHFLPLIVDGKPRLSDTVVTITFNVRGGNPGEWTGCHRRKDIDGHADAGAPVTAR